MKIRHLPVPLLAMALIPAFSGCKESLAPGNPSEPCVQAQQCESREPSTAFTYPPLLGQMWEVTGELKTYSSPRATDLNGDCIDDIILGHGEEEAGETGGGVGYVTAHDGATGEELWRAGPEFEGSAPLYEIVGSPTLIDINEDATHDIVIGGRDGTLIAIDGTDGTLLWHFNENGTALEDGWFNFYTTQVIDDVDNDGIPDLLSANGGNAQKAPFEQRSPGFLMILSGATGDVLSFAQVPDGRETYMSPIVYSPRTDLPTYVLLGTGGETFEGALWRVTLESLIAGDLSNAQQLTTPQSHKGVIAPPSIADLNLDGIQDIVVVTFDGQVEAFDGATGDSLWHYTVSGYSDDEVESYSSPAIGYFNGDGAPDVFVVLSIGQWPQYSGSVQVALSGWSGHSILKKEEDVPAFASPLAVDLNGDNRDEAIFTLPDFMTNTSLLRILDFANDQEHDYSMPGAGASTPLIQDLDHDGVLEIITCLGSQTQSSSTWTLARHSLNAPASGIPAWGSYLGSFNSGQFRQSCLESD